MKQRSLGTGFEKKSKRTRKREFLEEMALVVPWRDLVSLIEPHRPPKTTGRPAFAMETMLRIHLSVWAKEQLLNLRIQKNTARIHRARHGDQASGGSAHPRSASRDQD